MVESELFEIYGRVALTCRNEKFEVFFKPLIQWFSISVYCPQKGYFAAVFEDITERKKAEEALAASNAKITGILESNKDGFFALDQNWNIAYVNKTAAKIWRVKLERVVGFNFWERFPKLKGSIVEENLRSAMETRKLNRFEVGGIYTHGYYEAKVFPSQEGISVLLGDITERKKNEDLLRESEVKFRTVADFTFDWEYWIAPDGHMIYVSPSSKAITGYDASEFIKDPKLLTRIVHPDDKLIVGPHFDLISSDELHDVDFRILTQGGETRWISHSCKAVFDDNGKWIGRRASNRDITDRKQMEVKLEEYSKHLEDLVEERTKQLKDSERLAAIGATAGMVGHDIRNPLQAIIGDVYLAKTELASFPESAEKKGALESLLEIEKNIDYINKIVADLQDFARPLNPHAEEADLKLIIDELLGKNGLPDNVKVSIKVESDAKKVVADASYINRILFNLVNNAVQAMPKGGKLAIRACKEANDVVITVKDTGVGISEAVKSKLFTPMFTTKSKGQGFGLPVVKRMTEALGGTVNFSSKEGKGTTFIVRLPSSKELNAKWAFNGT